MNYRAFYEHLAAEPSEPHYEYFAPARRLQETIALCLRSPSKRILDVGCGDGILLAALGDRTEFGGDRLVGVDLAESLLRRVPRRTGLHVSCADAVRLPFGAETFDLVVCAEVVEHLPDPKAALAEMNRVARVGGRLVLAVPVVGWSRWAEAALTGHVRFLSETEHLREYAAVDLERCVSIRELIDQLAHTRWRTIYRRGVYYYPHRGERMWNAVLGHTFLSRPANWFDHQLGSVRGLAGWGRYMVLECAKE